MEGAREYARRSHIKNKDKIRERQRRWYAENKELARLRHRIYYEKNKEKLQARERLYRANNKEKLAARAKAWYQANKNWIQPLSKEKTRQWRLEVSSYNRTWRDTMIENGCCLVCAIHIGFGEERYCEECGTKQRMQSRQLARSRGRSPVMLGGVLKDDKEAYGMVCKTIAEQYVQGKSSGVLAKEWKCSISKIVSIVRQQGFEVRKKGPVGPRTERRITR